jgi:hypothetical protein
VQGQNPGKLFGITAFDHIGDRFNAHDLGYSPGISWA